METFINNQLGPYSFTTGEYTPQQFRGSRDPSGVVGLTEEHQFYARLYRIQELRTQSEVGLFFQRIFCYLATIHI